MSLAAVRILIVPIYACDASKDVVHDTFITIFLQYAGKKIQDTSFLVPPSNVGSVMFILFFD